MEIEFAVGDRKRAAIFVIIIIICIGLIVDDIFSGDEKNMNKDVVAVVTDNKEISKKNAIENKKTSEIADVKVNMAVFEKNPFIELSTMQTINPKTMQPVNSPNMANLPAIPNQPLPTIPVPNIQMPPNVSTMRNPMLPSVKATNQQTIQGIITGADGTNTAIMGNGKVLTEGEVFQDNRITYIGEAGITFEDGHEISYNKK